MKQGLPANKEYVNELMRQYDRNEDHAIDFDEFRHYVRRREGHMEHAFRYNDSSVCRPSPGSVGRGQLWRLGSNKGLGIMVGMWTRSRGSGVWYGARYGVQLLGWVGASDLAMGDRSGVGVSGIGLGQGGWVQRLGGSGRR